MSDINCVVCGEPWDSYGVQHGDMLPWEAKLFRAGAGCPCCKGEKPEQPWEPTGIFDLDNGDRDPIERLNAWEASQEGTAPKWERPADPVHWTCDGCGVQVVTNVDDNALEYHVPHDAKCRQWYHSHPFTSRYADPQKEPAHTFGNGVKVCEFCLDHCTDCGAPLASTVEFGDTYDEGNPFLQPGSHTDCVCVDCYEKYCSTCENSAEDCTCCHECSAPEGTCDCEGDEEHEDEDESEDA